MSTDTNHKIDVTLTSTLQLALSQCEEQVQKISKQSETIENLRLENQRLRQKLEQFRAQRNEDVEARYRTQFQDAFKQVAAKQVEIDQLKEKLRTVRIKARRRGLHEPISSSPNVHFSPAEHGSQQSATRSNLTSTPATRQVVAVSTPLTDESLLAGPILSRKRPRSHSPVRRPLQEISGNVDSTVVRWMKKENDTTGRHSRNERGSAGIPEVAEDGDIHTQRERETGAENANKVLPSSIYTRLGDLLDGRTPENISLLRTRSISPTVRIQSNATQDRYLSDGLGFPTPHSEARSKKARTGFTISRRRVSPGLEDEEPFRSRPVNRLGLMHFKLNPATNSGLDYAYNQTVRGAERRCLPGCTRECCVGTFRSLAETLPNPAGRDGQLLSDSDMLVQYLGHGSEDRIRSLTPKARENLLHDARIKLVADTYGKMHRDMHERRRSPPGFWRTDMPGSQEEKQDRERAKIAEREEVIRRHNEALKEGGRWVFADE